MASTQSRLFYLLLKLIDKKSFLKKQLNMGKRNLIERSIPPARIYNNCRVNYRQLNGHNIFTLAPKSTIGNRQILYLHGGAYVQSFTTFHWNFLSDLVQNCNCTITAPDYPLAPQFTYRDCFKMLVPLYNELIAKVGSDLFLMGDSAGGGLALALAQKMSKENVKQPGHIILLSPWLDLALTNPAIKEIEPLDPFLGLEGLKLAGKAFAGETSQHYYLLSPINGPLEGLAEISLFVGSNEIFVADARKLKALAEAKGAKLNYFEYADMLHVWMFFNFPEARKARQKIFELIAGS